MTTLVSREFLSCSVLAVFPAHLLLPDCCCPFTTRPNVCIVPAWRSNGFFCHIVRGSPVPSSIMGEKWNLKNGALWSNSNRHCMGTFSFLFAFASILYCRVMFVPMCRWKPLDLPVKWRVFKAKVIPDAKGGADFSLTLADFVKSLYNAFVKEFELRPELMKWNKVVQLM